MRAQLSCKKKSNRDTRGSKSMVLEFSRQTDEGNEGRTTGSRDQERRKAARTVQALRCWQASVTGNFMPKNGPAEIK